VCVEYAVQLRCCGGGMNSPEGGITIAKIEIGRTRCRGFRRCYAGKYE